MLSTSNSSLLLASATCHALSSCLWSSGQSGWKMRRSHSGQLRINGGVVNQLSRHWKCSQCPQKVLSGFSILAFLSCALFAGPVRPASTAGSAAEGFAGSTHRLHAWHCLYASMRQCLLKVSRSQCLNASIHHGIIALMPQCLIASMRQCVIASLPIASLPHCLIAPMHQSLLKYFTASSKASWLRVKSQGFTQPNSSALEGK
jgi:hypothetical protein